MYTLVKALVLETIASATETQRSGRDDQMMRRHFPTWYE
jgi:hypothetical protein